MQQVTDNSKYGSAWSHDELVLALYLYCQIPFAQTKASNLEVKRLAQVIGRTPSSVARKLGNFGAFDPLLAQQGITGLVHYSKADRQVWDEYAQHWEALVAESQRILALASAVELSSGPAAAALVDESIVITLPRGLSEQPRVVMTRLFQSFFRRAVLSSYKSACCVCGLDLSPLLIASHIVPWAVREDARADPQNGLCLCALHDKAFDTGFLSVAPDHRILTAPALRTSRALFTQSALLAFRGQRIQLPDRFSPKAEYLQWHNEKVFQQH